MNNKIIKAEFCYGWLELILIAGGIYKNKWKTGLSM